MSQDSTAPVVVYKDIPGFPGYRAGSDGTIWSAWMKNAPYRAVLGTEWHELRRTPHCKGYLAVALCRDGKRFGKLVHVLVLLAHVGPCPPGHEAAHDNGIRTDCRLSNLAYKTKKANAEDKKRHGTYKCGEQQNGAKLEKEQVIEIRRRRDAGESLLAIASDFGITISNVSAIHLRKSWTHV